jgi:hypothetical protein
VNGSGGGRCWKKPLPSPVPTVTLLFSEGAAEIWTVAAYPPHVGTIGDKIRIGHSITVNCGNWECLHRVTLDLEDIAARFGAEAYSFARRSDAISKPRPPTEA